MRARGWIFIGIFVVLGLIYVYFFTEWLRPAPIEIASQVRFSLQPPQIRQPALKNPRPGTNQKLSPDQMVRVFTPDGQTGMVSRSRVIVKRTADSRSVTNEVPTMIPFVSATPPSKAAKKAQEPALDRIGRPDKSIFDPTVGGPAPVTFSFDAWYKLTRVRVEDVPVDGSTPKVMWELVGQSLPTESLLYRRVPPGMRPLVAGSDAEPLVPGAPYRLIIEAGRRRGTNNFTTVELAPQ
jgi:hypothetical protein